MVKPSAEIPPDVRGRTYDHFNVLRTIEQNFGVGQLGDGDGRATPISDIWR